MQGIAAIPGPQSAFTMVTPTTLLTPLYEAGKQWVNVCLWKNDTTRVHFVVAAGTYKQTQNPEKHTIHIEEPGLPSLS